VKRIVCLGLVAACALQVALAKSSFFKGYAENNNVAALSTPVVRSRPAMPDLIVRGNEFEFVGNKTVNVYVSNNGDAPSGRCILELTVRKIGDSKVGRVKRATIPALQPGKFTQIPVDATSILPNAVSLKDTTFKVIADSTNMIAESNEGNNEKWHNLQ
jgi:subtilase family serine protease